VLQDKGYQRFAAANTVEVLHMEETDRALAEKNRLVRTYRQKDAYGEEVEYLEEFPGLPLEALQRINENQAVLRYMTGGKIPYTAIVDPFTLEEMEHIQGVYRPKDLMDKVTRHGKALVGKHGKGVDRRLWNDLQEAEVRIDVLLGDERLAEAIQVVRELARKADGAPALQSRVEACWAAVLDDASKRLDKLGTMEPKDAAKELDSLARVLKGTRLESRVRELLRKN